MLWAWQYNETAKYRQICKPPRVRDIVQSHARLRILERLKPRPSTMVYIAPEGIKLG